MRILWKLKFNFCVYRGLLLLAILSHLNTAHILTYSFIQI
jgi:hypothetical protein